MSTKKKTVITIKQFLKKLSDDKKPHLHREGVFLFRLDDLNWVVCRANTKGNIPTDRYAYYANMEHALNRFLAECTRDLYIPEKPEPMKKRMDRVRQEMADTIHKLYSQPWIVGPTK